MNYCTIEDAWKSSDHLTEQFSFYKKKTIENFEIQEEKVQKNMNNTNMNNMNMNMNNINTNMNMSNMNTNMNMSNMNTNMNMSNMNTNMNTNTSMNTSMNTNMNTNTNTNMNNNLSNNNDYLDSVFICNDFWDHLNKCSSCRNKMRQRFSSNVMEKFENVVIDNKDTILIFLICLFALIFCNLLVSIINK